MRPAQAARREQLPERFEELASRTLGYGEPSWMRLRAQNRVAVFVWQDVLSHKGDTARVVVPIPATWLTETEEPLCEIVVAWGTPVNAAVQNMYGCRRVNVSLPPTPDSDAIRGSRGWHPAYLLRVRRYALAKALAQGKVTDDLWTVELNYDEICDYPATQTFTPEQRV